MENKNPSKSIDNLIKYKDVKANNISNQNSLFWYNMLEKLGKQAQTEEIVYTAVSSFDVVDSNYLILKLVAKRYLTKEVCEMSVRKNGLNLKYVPEYLRDIDMSYMAVSNNGDSLGSVPDSILCGEKGYDICCVAVRNSFNGNAVEFVPKKYLKGDKGKCICNIAVRANAFAIDSIPRKFLSKELVNISLDAPVSKRQEYRNETIISLIPERYITKEIVAKSVQRWPESIMYAPVKYVTNELCDELVRKDPMNLQYIPSNMMSRRLIDYALKENPRVIMCLPREKLTKKRCLDAIQRDQSISTDGFPDSIIEYIGKFMDKFIDYEPLELQIPCSFQNEGLIPEATNSLFQSHDLNVFPSFVKTVYYITDIHLEHQLSERPLEICNMSVYEIKRRIKKKIIELLNSIPDPDIDSYDMLLIGGDVADSVELEKMFYEQLVSDYGWQGEIISVLGNHELWDGDPTGSKPVHPLDEIIDDYRRATKGKARILENELFLMYKNQTRIVLDEQTILDADIDKLHEVCENSTFLVLGGIGFSGINPVFNAKMGLYGAAVSLEEDHIRTERFRAVYDKILASAKDIPVIVLTHTQMEDWSNESYNPKWIYVNGHTHQNRVILDSSGTTVFADNQVGYKPRVWHLNRFSIDAHIYDPFINFSNGIHEISREQYIEFNRGRGIVMEGMKAQGKLYTLKYDGVYMFVLKSKSSLCILEGGKRRKLDHDIDYYYSNLAQYIDKVRDAFAPYRMALDVISHEVRIIGGTGRVHGCIVDIDFYNHIYLNPFDGKITPYFALDMEKKMAYKDIKSLIKSSPIPPQVSDGSSILKRYSTALDQGLIPKLSHKANKKWDTVVIPEIVLDKSIYQPSRIMRSIQYVFDNNVVRIWIDKILSLNDNGMELNSTSRELIE